MNDAVYNFAVCCAGISCVCAKAVDLIEVFAGAANTTFAFRKRGLRALKLDLKYGKRQSRHRSDFMDLTSSSGFLHLDPTKLNLQFGVCVARITRTFMNRGWPAFVFSEAASKTS